MSFLLQVLTATIVTSSLLYVFAIFGKNLTIGLNAKVIFSSDLNSIILARTYKQSNVYNLLIFGKYLKLEFFA